MPNKEADTGWDNPVSYIKKSHGKSAKKDKECLPPKIIYQGAYCYHGIEFRFSLTQQESGKYVMRGRVSAISPVDGFVLQVTGAEKTRRLGKLQSTSGGNDNALEMAEPSPGPIGSVPKAKRQKCLNVTTEVYCKSCDEAEVKTAVAKAALRLYTQYAPLIHQRQKQVSRPDCIVPSVAGALYAEDFVNTNYRNAAASTHKQYVKAIKGFFSQLPDIPMAKMTRTQMRKILADRRAPANTLRLAIGFWEFCTQKGICSGISPFSQNLKKRKTSAETKQAKALVPDELSPKMQEQLFQYLMSSDPSGEACGIALMLWGGFSAKNACGFKWIRLQFDDTEPDFIRLVFRQGDKAGATHDFTRPLFPQAARILLRRFQQLADQYGRDEILAWPIVSAKRLPQKAMTADALTQGAGRVLRVIGITEEIFSKLKTPKLAVSGRILHNTYVKNLIYRCGLANDPGTVKFMLGVSLSESVTDDHYTSFVSPLAAKRIFTALKAAGPLEMITETEEPEITDDGNEQRIISPQSTHHRVGVVADIVLQPDEELAIFNPHGVSGSIRSRAITETSLRRKSPKKQKRILTKIENET